MFAVRYTAHFVQLVGQEAALSTCVLLHAARKVRTCMREQIISDQGHRRSVALDARVLGRVSDSTLRYRA